MTWVKLDDQFFAHERVVGLSKDAKLLYLAGLTYCSAQLTDGRIGRGAVRVVAALADVVPDVALGELTDAGLWSLTESGYIVHDYLDYNPTAAQVKAQRVANTQRQAEWRERKAARNGVTNDVTNDVSSSVTNSVRNAVNNGPVTAPRPGPSPSPEEATTTVVAMAIAAPSPEAQRLIDRWRAAHGKKKPPRLNPTQLQALEAAIPELGIERLEEAVDWSAQQGVEEFIKCIRGAYTKRQQDESPSAPTRAGSRTSPANTADRYTSGPFGKFVHTR